jgi:hypothetical protein
MAPLDFSFHGPTSAPIPEVHPSFEVDRGSGSLITSLINTEGKLLVIHPIRGIETRSTVIR